MPLKLFQQSLPQPVYSATQVLEHEKCLAQSLNIDLYDLMRKAGAAAFEHFIQCYPDIESKLLVICGKGNNGGDGFVFATLAHDYGYSVEVICLAEADQIVGDAKKALHTLQESSIEIRYLSDLQLAAASIKGFCGQVIIDAIFGIGFKGELSSTWSEVIEQVNCHEARKFSIDVPSGLNASTGHVSSIAVIADQTISFIVMKQGLLTGQASLYTGNLYCADLGIGKAFIQSLAPTVFAQGSDNLPLLTHRIATMHKGHIGLALTVGGNENMPGAIRLASESALRSGAALVAVCCHHDSQGVVFNDRPELMLAPSDVNALAQSSFIDKAKVILIGPGLGVNQWARQLFQCISTREKPLVVDADALRLLSQYEVKRDDWVLTPHPGEAASLLNTDTATIEQDRFGAVKAIANRYGGICVLKGAGSLISDGNMVWINQTGNAGMASGGMGDVLSGIIAAFMQQSSSSFDAARLAVSIHGQAADIIAKQYGQRGLLASDLFEPMRQLVNKY